MDPKQVFGDRRTGDHSLTDEEASDPEITRYIFQSCAFSAEMGLPDGFQKDLWDLISTLVHDYATRRGLDLADPQTQVVMMQTLAVVLDVSKVCATFPDTFGKAFLMGGYDDMRVVALASFALGEMVANTTPKPQE